MSLVSAIPQPRPVQDHRDAAFLVSAIGSCRVAGPLRKAKGADGFAFNQTGVYGYCHSSAEALQQLRVLQGELTIPAELEPLIAPSGLRSEPHVPSDMYFVEICSAKQITTHGYSVQLNYLTRKYEDFFSDKERVRAFWRHAREGDAAKMQAFLLEERAFWSLDETDRDLLKDIRLELATPASLEADVLGIQERVPAALFVTHFNATKHDGTLLHARKAFIDLATSVFKACNLPFFDPTDYVGAYGVGRALAHGNQSLTHYSEDFEAVLLDNWVRRYVRPAMTRVEAGRRTTAQPPIVTKLAYS